MRVSASRSTTRERKRSTTRTIGLLICLVLIFGLFGQSYGPLKAYAEPDPTLENGQPDDGRTTSTTEPSTTNAVESTDASTEAGSGTPDDPYIITTPEELYAINDGLDASYKLGADIDLNGYEPEATGWGPIGTVDYSVDGVIDPFTGTLDGDGHTISGLTFNGPGVEDGGLFEYTLRATIKNLILSNVDITAASNTGALAGMATATTIDHVMVESGHIVADQGDSRYNVNAVGGLVGQTSTIYDGKAGKFVGTTITNSRTNVKISIAPSGASSTGIVSTLGGLVGYALGAVISFSSAEGDILGSVNTMDAGGLIGQAQNVTVSQSFATGDVQSHLYSGGFIGDLNMTMTGSITDNYATGDVIVPGGVGSSWLGGFIGFIQGSSQYQDPVAIEHNYYGGKILYSENASGAHIGGFTGQMISTDSFFYHFAGNYYNPAMIEVPFWMTGDNYLTPQDGMANAITVDQMRQQATFDLPNDSVQDWDFENIWVMSSGTGEKQGFPVFQWTGVPSNPGEQPSTPTDPEGPVDNGGGGTTEPQDPTGNDGGSTELPYNPGTGSMPSAPTGSTKEVGIIVDMGDGQPQVSIAKVERTTGTDGSVKDDVTFNRDKAQEAVDKAVGANQPTVRIVIPDELDEVAETKVNVPNTALQTVLTGNKNLEIFTANAKVIVPNGSMADFSDDLYFRLVPVKQKQDQEVIRERAVQEPVVKDIAKDLAPYVVSRPMTIETNMESRPVTLVLPLKDVAIPTNAQEKKAFLDSLAIYIEHGDGTKELVRGKVVEYGNGSGELGLQFGVEKFSTFTILSWDGKDLTEHPAYVKGYPDDTFKPERAITRAEMAMLLARNLGYADTEAASTAAYPDLTAVNWANGAIAFVKEKNLMIGDNEGNFRPEAAVTRAEMAVLAARYEQLAPLKGTSAKGVFNDTDSHWAAGSIAAAKQAGLIKGYQDGSYKPNRPLSRAEAVTVVNQLFDRGPLYGVDTPFWSDVPSSNWAYADIMEASYSHNFDVRPEGGETVK